MKSSFHCCIEWTIVLALVTTALATAKQAQASVKAINDKTTSSASNHASPLRKWRCPWKCRCNLAKKEVNCAFRKLTKVPKGIPASVRKLVLTGNKLKKLPNKSFKLYKQLEVLELDGNYLENISNKPFRNLRKLKRLNLGSNKIEQIQPQSFSKLKRLKVLLLRKNKLGKLPVNVFSGLKRVTEIDLSSNFLQTLEEAMFGSLELLNELYLDRNRWHCDCQLKTLEVALRKRKVRTGYIVCNSPKKFGKQHLRDNAIDTLCGIDSTSLAGILLGVICGFIVILFAIFMCRKRAASTIEVNEATAQKKKSVKLRKRSVSDSSVISADSQKEHQSEEKENEELLNTSFELDAKVLSPLAENQEHHNSDISSTSKIQSTTTSTRISYASSENSSCRLSEVNIKSKPNKCVE